jgi:rhodanese-related sulfurtransferase
MNIHYAVIFALFQFAGQTGELSVFQVKPGTLSPAEFQKKLKSDPKAVLLDVRTPEETNEGIIEGAITIDFYKPDFEKKLNALDKSKNYYVYCKAGSRSSKASNVMSGKGFKTIYNLDGGIMGWKEAGLKVVKPK